MKPASYQVVLLGGGCSVQQAAFLDVLERRLGDISAEVKDALKIIGASTLSSLVPTAPTVVVYFGIDTVTHEAEVRTLQAASMPILPVVAKLDDYSLSTPALLHPVNGLEIKWAAPDFGELVNLVMENLALLRRTRRLFISYFRKESEEVAHQLRIAFDDRGYDTFLDKSSVPRGDDFQAVLWHRLLDSDVMIVLDTPKFLTSRWTQKELAQASAMSVGMLRVVWPGVDRVPAATLALHHYLDNTNFTADGLLADATVAQILNDAESLRARCIAARHTNLIVEFCAEARRAGATTVVQPNRYVIAKLKGKTIAAIPAVGVLDAQRYHDAHTRFPTRGKHADAAVLIYDHRGMMEDWQRFLEWLDDHLPVRGLRVTDTAAKLGGP